jgi:hypothetical protein
MTQKQLYAILAISIPPVIQLIMDKQQLDNIEAAKLFYHSSLYKMLENEASKVWHLSALTLYELFEEEQATGIIQYPEEA